MALRIDPFGPHALLVRFADQGDEVAFGRAQALLRHFDSHPPNGLIEVTPGFTTVLLEFKPGMRPEGSSLAAVLHGVLRNATTSHTPSRILEIPVVYDGPDLERVAAHAGLGIPEVIQRHTAVTYRVQILGFAPGFPYLSGLDRRLHIPRMATPRAEVPAGSVAIGGEHTGIYPVATAGGWNLIGRTDAQLVDLARAAQGQVEAFLLRPGDGVRFIQIAEVPPAAGSVEATSRREEADPRPSDKGVLAPGSAIRDTHPSDP